MKETDQEELFTKGHICIENWYPKNILRTLKIQQKERTKNSAKEMVKSHQRRYTNGKYASEKMLSIPMLKGI